VDDMISAGTTIAHAAQACRNAGATAVHAAATHAIFAPTAGATLGAAPIDGIVVTDTIVNGATPVDSAIAPKVVRLSIAQSLASAIDRMHRNQSIVELTGE
jgi:ribose-phosphate pyrophosphokinase